jgi:hypothetical protein
MLTILRLTSATIVLAIVASLPAEALTRHVAVNGVDSPTCGTRDEPCRTITQGVAQADPYDTVLVGPGSYRVADGEGTPACQCVVWIGKPGVRVISVGGAAATLITDDGVYAGGTNGTVVRISQANPTLAVEDVTFGEAGRGFTVLVYASEIDFPNSGILGGTWVSDNVVLRPARLGAASGAGIRAQHMARNRVIGRFRAGLVVSDFGTLSNNVAVVGGPLISTSRAFVILGAADVVGNLAMHHEIGFLVMCSAVGCPLFEGNSAIQNGTGITVLTVQPVVVTSNNIYGNVCGVGADPSLVDLSGNYWGAATGPGVDPADDLCGGGGAAGLPFSPRPFPLPRFR